MKRSLSDGLVREAIGRILRDASFAGDGKMLLEALENERETVPFRMGDACALQAEWGRRKLAHDLIEIGREEFERVTTESSLSASRRPGDGSATSFGSGASASIFERSSSGKPAPSGKPSRRRGPAASFDPSS